MKKLGPVNALYPMPTTLVGSTVNGKPNFLTVAHVGIFNHGTPQYLSIGLYQNHYSNAGIRENKAFSICLPSRDLMVKTDYCGIMTGKKTDKAALFTVFYGKTKHAPMIEECPVNMELTLKDILHYEKHDIFVGELVETHVSEEVLSGEKIDIQKVSPLLFDMASKEYWTLGPSAGKCWHEGKALKP
ncbi:MAG: flavin reductase family protein [Desulfobacteraceae bacterium]|nr:flavin reductase family protein [Desulfobacteraceae bacterium]